jgi:cell wall assembly regulator SMI1
VAVLPFYGGDGSFLPAFPSKYKERSLVDEDDGWRDVAWPFDAERVLEVITTTEDETNPGSERELRDVTNAAVDPAQIQGWAREVRDVHRIKIPDGAIAMKGWVPIGKFGDGADMYLDINPAPGGTVGQIIYSSGEYDGSIVSNINQMNPLIHVHLRLL